MLRVTALLTGRYEKSHHQNQSQEASLFTSFCVTSSLKDYRISYYYSKLLKLPLHVNQ